MRIEFWVIAETNEAYLKEGIEIFEKRIGRYVPFSMQSFQSPKKVKAPSDLKRMEGEMILSKILPGDRLILLDERDKEFKSREYAQWLQKQMNIRS